jgi:alkyl sulfatase BDS1-like metallo-beta-lactamase superfamily hydrolase
MKSQLFILPILMGFCFLFAQCSDGGLDNQIKDPSVYSQAFNANYADSSRLNWADKTDFETSQRGFLAGPKDSVILALDGSGDTVWNFRTWNFLDNLESPSPTTVNPSLWRQEKLNQKAGLFEVLKGRIYQIRNFDLAVMSFVIGDNGYIVIDPLGTPATAKAGHDLFKTTIVDKLPNANSKTLKALVFTHSHIDHFGGVYGIFPKGEIGNAKIYAPEGFLEEAVSENVYAGNVMGQRANYMYGNLLPKNTKQGIGAGLGLTTSTGSSTILDATVTINNKMTLSNNVITDLAGTGLNLQFLPAPHTEAPAEMLFYFPQFNALCAAEDAVHTLHNLYSLRGAKTRSAKEWVEALTKVLDLWGNKVEVEFNSHHWPVWTNEGIKNHIETQRAMYKFIHDQTLRLANMGYDMTTTAEIITHLPESLNKVWSSQGYYGSVNHNVKATWDLYLGWFDGNPAHLHQLPAISPHSVLIDGKEVRLNGASAKYVEYMGRDNIVTKAQKDFAKGEYRWVAEVLQHVVNVDANDPKTDATAKQKVKFLLADALEQMGYQAISGPWRDFYLSGALELRNGRQGQAASPKDMAVVLAQMSTNQIFDYISILVDPYKAKDKQINFAFIVKDGIKSERMTYQLKYSCLNHLVDRSAKLDFTLTINKQDLKTIMVPPDPIGALVKAIESGEKFISVSPQGSGLASLKELASVIGAPSGTFNIVTPNLPMPKPINPMKAQQR